MARPKKEKKVEVPEESLSKVLSPGYTLEIQQELTIVGPDEPVTAEADKVESHEFFTLSDATKPIEMVNRELQGNILFQNLQQVNNVFRRAVHMVIRFPGVCSRKSSTTYQLEDIMDSMALGLKVDAYEQIKGLQDEFAFDVDLNAVKALSSKLTRDFSRFYNEIETQYRIKLKHEITTKDVAKCLHDGEPIAVLFEVVR